MSKKKIKVIEELVGSGLSILPDLPALLTPAIVTNPGLVVATVGAAIASKKISSFLQEYQARKKQKQIRDDLNSAESTYDILKFIAENPEDERIEAVKKLFFKNIALDISDADKVLTFQLIQICKQLSTNDLMVLRACFGLKIPSTHSRHRGHWFYVVSKKIGHGLPSLVETSEAHLIELKLIAPIEDRNPGQFFPEGEARLTDLGVKLCEYLAK